MENPIDFISITTGEYKKLVKDSILLNMVKEHARQEEYLADWRIREIIGVPKPEKKEGEE